MTRRTARYQKRIESSARREVRRLGQPLSREQVFGLRVQVVPAFWRWGMGLAGLACLGAAFSGVPWSGNTIQGIEVIMGMALVAFGVFGIRRTVSQLVETMDALMVAELLGTVIGAVGDAFDP